MLAAGFVHAAFGEEAGQGTQGGQDLGAVRVPHLAAVLVVGAIPRVMVAVFDGPLAAGHLEQGLAVGAFAGHRRQTGDAQDAFVGFPAALQMLEAPMDAHDLGRRAEPHLVGFDGQRPDLTEF